jgi:hypothetical protein
MSRRPFFFLLLTPLLALWMIGCGGGGGTAGGGGGGGVFVPPDQVMAAVADTEAHFATVSSQPDWEQQMVAFLSGRPEFNNVGSSGQGTVWAFFGDGRPYLIVHNRRPGDSPDPNWSMDRSPATHNDLPKDLNTRLFNSLGNAFVDVTPALRNWLSSNNYVVTRQSGTLSQWRNVRNAGIFYVSTHAGTGEKDNTPFPAIMTGEKLTLAGVGDVISKNIKGVGYITADQDLDGNGNLVPSTNFAVGAEFIREYMTFAENSIVYIDACESAHPHLKQAFLDKGASLYVGWTMAVTDSAAVLVSRFFFDRMLGGNRFARENPNQRPFDWQAVLQNMKERGIHLHPAYDANGKQIGNTEIQFFPGNGNFGILTPTIRFLTVAEGLEELHIDGIFGNPPADDRRVTIDGTEVTIKSWESGKIVVELPRSGAGSAGDVVVGVKGSAGLLGSLTYRESNKVQLTEWRGALHYTYTIGGQNGLKHTATLNIQIRGDISSHRDKPGETPHEPIIPFLLGGDSDGSWTASGSHTVGDAMTGTRTETWSGSGTLQHMLVNPQSLISGAGSIDAKQKRLTFTSLSAMGQPGYNARHVARSPDGTVYQDNQQTFPFGLWGTIDIMTQQHFPIEMFLDSNYDILAGQYTKDFPQNLFAFGMGEEPGSCVITWERIPATHRPKADASRKAQR